MNRKKGWLCAVVMLCSLVTAFGQAAKVDKKAFQLVDKAIGAAMESGDVSISFEGLAFGIREPLSIFTLPVYQVSRGGYMYIDGNKFEMQLGSMKTLSDGKLMVAIDEVSKSMFIDSVRSYTPFDSSMIPDEGKLMTEMIGEGTMSYLGQENVNGRLCHKIRSDFNNEEKNFVLYWIEVKTGQLYVMAEWQNSAYDVYWVRSIAKAPKGHVYSIKLPKKELEKMYGYEVFDHRFAVNDLRKK